MAITIKTFESRDALETTMFQALKDALQLDEDSPSAVMFSGGSTPLALYQQMAKAPFEVPETTLAIFADDRHVPHDSPNSNYGNMSIITINF